MKDKKGSALITVMFLLSAMLVVSLIAMEIISSGIKRRRSEGASAKAFYAAESGLELALEIFRHDATIPLDSTSIYDKCLRQSFRYVNVEAFRGNHSWSAINVCSNESNCICIGSDNLNYGTYYLNGDSSLPKFFAYVTTSTDPNPIYPTSTPRELTVHSNASYLGTAREVAVSFCLPSCYLKSAGDNDGCGGECN